MASAPEISRIQIREIDELAQMRAVEELQKEIWGIPDLDVVPLTHLVAAREAGGVLIGAFEGETLVGFVYGFTSFERGQLAHHSHMLAVKADYRNLDLGGRLKLAQREHVMAQGIGLISWTFDPLQSLNAYFNFSKLAVLADRYLPNFYGDDAASFLHQTGTDRLWVSWFVSSERVQRKIYGGSDDVNFSSAPSLIEIAADDAARRNDFSDQNRLAIEIPSNIDELQRQNRATARRWREETRSAFTEALMADYFVESFARETRDEKQIGKYFLRKGAI